MRRRGPKNQNNFISNIILLDIDSLAAYHCNCDRQTALKLLRMVFARAGRGLAGTQRVNLFR